MRQPTESSKPSKIPPPKLDYRSMVSVDDMPELFVSFDSKSNCCYCLQFYSMMCCVRAGNVKQEGL